MATTASPIMSDFGACFGLLGEGFAWALTGAPQDPQNACPDGTGAPHFRQKEISAYLSDLFEPGKVDSIEAELSDVFGCSSFDESGSKPLEISFSPSLFIKPPDSMGMRSETRSLVSAASPIKDSEDACSWFDCSAGNEVPYLASSMFSPFVANLLFISIVTMSQYASILLSNK